MSIKTNVPTCHNSALDTETERALAEIGRQIGVKLEIRCEDRMRGAIAEACMWLNLQAPGRALEVLETALKL